ncbi:unnamed protein product [Ectocarpus sp. 6 AP-2014]
MKTSMTSVVALTSASCAAAFVAPSAFTGGVVSQQAKSSSSALSMAAGPASSGGSFESAIGAQPPLGFYDPAGLLTNADQERFDRLRYVEIKHGRISMLAVAGHLVQQNFRLPGMLSTSADLSFADMPNGLAALSKIPALGLFQIIAFIGFLEIGVMKQKEGSFPGDMTLGGEPYAWTKFSDEVKEQKRAIELNNGRAAQMGILGLMMHEAVNNHPYIINDLLGMPYTFN